MIVSEAWEMHKIRLQTERLSNGHRRVLKTICRKYGDDKYICVTAGFVTDFSSIPWFARWIVDWKKVDVAGCMHDYAYYYGLAIDPITRKEADLIWLKIARQGKVRANLIQAYLCYWGLRLGGWYVWNKYRREYSVTKKATLNIKKS